MPRIALADHADHAFATHDLAVLAELPNRCANLHGASPWEPRPSLLVPVDDAAPAEIVRRQLHGHLVAGQDANEVHAHLARDVRQDLVTILELDAEHRVRQRLDDGPLDLDSFFFGHSPPYSPG